MARKSVSEPIGNITYNGYQFTELVKTKCRMTPTYNQAGDSMMYVKYLITVEAIIHYEDLKLSGTTLAEGTGDPASEGTDDQLEAIRRVLTQPHKQLIFTKKGLGSDLDTNSRKVASPGPKPREISWEILGSNNVARIMWEVEFDLIECQEGNKDNVNLLDIWYETTQTVNDVGIQTFTQKGQLKVPQRVSSAGQIIRSDKGLRNEFNKFLANNDIFEGYKRSHSTSINANNTTLDFTITYKQVDSPNVYPPGVEDIDVDHEVESGLIQSGFQRWTNNMTGTITLRPGVNRGRAWTIFAAIAADRVRTQIRTSTSRKGRKKEVRVYRPIYLSIKIKESLFKRSLEFSISWWNFTATVDELLSGMGLFRRPDTGSDPSWKTWTGDIRKVEGLSGVNLDVSGSLIAKFVFNVCDQKTQYLPADYKSLTQVSEIPTFLNTECPPKESSWIDWKNDIQVIGQTGRVVHRVIETDTVEGRGKSPDGKTVEFEGKMDEEFKKDQPTEVFVQDTAGDSFTVVMSGYAMRLGGPTRSPQLKEVGGIEVTLIDSKVDEEIFNTNPLCPLYINRWFKTYESNGRIDSTRDWSKNRKGSETPESYQQ
jgi:hypothetical protein